MNRRRAVLVMIAGALLVARWLLTAPSKSAMTRVSTNGPLLFLPSKPIRGSLEAAAPQQEGWDEQFRLSGAAATVPITNGFMFELTNRGPQTGELWGFNGSSPV